MILAIDTATPAVTAGVARRTAAGVEVLAEQITVDARAHADHGKKPGVFLRGALGEDEDVRAEFGQRVGDREAGVTEAQHGDAQALPIRVPTGEGIQTIHQRDNHST